MRKSYDPTMLSYLEGRFNMARQEIAILIPIQAQTRKSFKKLPKSHNQFPALRKRIGRNRRRLRILNKRINAYYSFCNGYDELKRFKPLILVER